MRRDAFIKELEYLLQDISDEDKADAIAYYRDYLEEAGPENEEQVIRDFGSPERIAAIIRADIYGNLEDGGEFTEKGYEDERFREPNFQIVKREKSPEEDEHGQDERGREAGGGRNSGYGTNPGAQGSRYGSGTEHGYGAKPSGGYASGGANAGSNHGTGSNYGAGNNYESGRNYGSGMTSAKPEKARWEWWQILGLIVLGCCVVPVLIPLIFGVGGGAIGLVFGLGGAALAVLATVSIGLAAVTFALLLGGVLLIIIAFAYMGAGVVRAALCLGTGVGVFGLGLLCLSLCGLYYGIFLPWLVKSLVGLMGRILHRKEAAV